MERSERQPTEDHQPADQVAAPRALEPAPLSPEGCEADWKDCLDAGHADGPTSAHPDAGWRAIPTAKP